MKKNMFASQALCAALSAMMLLTGCGGSGSAAPATTAAASGTQAAEAAAAETTTAPVFEVTLNYDLVDLLGNDADSVKKALGEAEADETAEAFRKMTFKGGKQIVMLYTDSEELNYGREGLVWLIEADASDIFRTNMEPENNAEFTRELNLGDAPEKISASSVPDYDFKADSDVLHFEYDGYGMYAVPDGDGNIGPDSRVVVCMPLEKDEPAPEEEEEDDEDSEKGV